MDIGRIEFSPSVASALNTIKEEAINAMMWQEEWAKKDYECEELREENKRLSNLVEELLCRPKECRGLMKKLKGSAKSSPRRMKS